MIVDHDHRCVLDVLENREKATVVAYLKAAKESGLNGGDHQLLPSTQQ
ncbi:hypothetical protein R5W24_004267 [Gemmata sp. JC717]|nr:hypothetical protein [Gemmata algarum]MDY3555131.1 hypothetical protein [Gemmata algarum]